MRESLKPKAALQARPSDASEEALRFHQSRVALFGLVGFGLGFSFWVFRAVVVLMSSSVDALVEPSMTLHLAGAGSMLLAWLVCRGARRPEPLVHAADAISSLTSAASYSAMGLYIPPLARPELIMALAIGVGVLTRAVFVPSTSLRTFVITALCGVPITVVGYSAYSTSEAAVLGSLYGTTRVSEASAVGAAAWWALITALAALTSHVIYGLRKQIHQARQLGQYTLEQKLGEGGMGVVYRASHAMLRRPAAVKLLPPAKAGEQTIARFEREVRLTAKLTHPNTVTIFDYGRTPDGIFYYAMELLDGATVEEIVEVGGAQPAARVVHVLLHVAGALAEAHDVGLIHRDIKPANVILCRRGGLLDVPKILDFGLVKDLHPDGGVSLTNTNTITGTPLYLPPEAVLTPEKVDARSDLYALGAVGYYMLTGEHVFSGNTIVEICSHHLQSPPTPPSERLGKPLPADIERVLLACLEKSPDKRPQSASELADLLRACHSAGTWTASEARAWWTEQGDAVMARRKLAADSGSAQTIAVDLVRR